MGEETRDFWWFIGILVALFFVWLATGGPDRPLAHSGPFLESPRPRAMSEIRRSYSDRPVSDSPSTPSLEAEKSQAPPSSNLSRYHGAITISTGNARYEFQPNQEYITLQARSSNAEPIAITGWYLKNGRDQRRYYVNYPVNTTPIPGRSDVVVIPFGTNLFIGGAPNWQADSITLKPGGRVIITTGQMPNSYPFPINTNFRTNRCSGYLDDWENFNFEPALNTICPEPIAETDTALLDDECYDFVRRLPACHAPELTIRNGDQYVDGRRRNLSAQCRDYVKSRFNYNACVARHGNEPDFLGGEWRVYLRRSWELWDDSREIITLLDQEGKIVDEVRY